MAAADLCKHASPLPHSAPITPPPARCSASLDMHAQVEYGLIDAVVSKPILAMA
jgi:hypothetical protein